MIMKLREYLWAEKIQQKDFAKLLKVTAQTIYNYTSGRTKPDYFYMELIKRFTNGKVRHEDWK